MGIAGPKSWDDVQTWMAAAGTVTAGGYTATGQFGFGTTSSVARVHIRGSGTSGQVTSSFLMENFSSGTFGSDITGSAGSSRFRFLVGGGPGSGTNTLTEVGNITLEGSSAGRWIFGTTTTAAKSIFQSNVSNSDAVEIRNYNTTAGTSYGLTVTAGTNGTDAVLRLFAADGSTGLGSVNGAGIWTLGKSSFADRSNNVHVLKGTFDRLDIQNLFDSRNVGGFFPVELWIRNNHSTPSTPSRFNVKGYNATNGELIDLGTSIQTLAGGSLGSYSDQRLKKNIAPLTGALDLLDQFMPKVFEWDIPNRPAGPQIGVMAQDVEMVRPSWVLGDGSPETKLDGSIVEDVKSITYGNDVFALLIAGIKELKEYCDTLETRIADLES